jgi:hypothetical protein
MTIREELQRRARRSLIVARVGGGLALAVAALFYWRTHDEGVLRASPSIATRLREAEDELARLEAQASTPIADIELLIPRLSEEIERAVRELPRTLAAGNVDLARQELKGLLGAIRVVGEPTEMLLYAETGFVEAALKRAAGGMASIVGSGGLIPTNSTTIVPFSSADRRRKIASNEPDQCGNGHRLTPDNVRIDRGEGRWRCRQCGCDRAAAFRDRQRTG